ncbi:probable methyltransferase-like protein 25 [Phlebotomus argentipes]|uniref:probable methyltransferase-like protein 25 n=1 Tax=Phlebotomus argentipes TaxID=94469 RepID=UPI0028933F22|nr:probable methyltransferase-like protein 25 [Phlebotomus argentipes]
MCTAESVQERLWRTVGFLREHQGIIDCHVVDFLWDNHWQKLLPSALREELEANAEEILKDLHTILSSNSSSAYKHLENFLTNAKQHSLSAFSGTTTLDEFLPESKASSVGLKVADFMTPKKMHEVKSAARLISWLCSQARKPTIVVDAGDGKGYLSSCLAFEHNLPVIGLEANADYQKSARNRVAKLKKKWKVPEREDNYKSLAVTVTSELRIGELSQDLFSTEQQQNFCLSGLHTCGDLAVNCLEIFTRDANVRFLCNIGCCYNLLTRFPLSHFLRNHGFTLSDKARMLACQSLNKIIAQETLPKDSLHFRALFEQMLKEKFPLRDFQQVGKVRSDNFIDYFKLCCDKMNLNYFYTDEELREKLTTYDRRRFDLFYVLRSSLAAAIEAVILLDRVLHLIEECEASEVNLVEIFQPEISPRCYALVAVKK